MQPRERRFLRTKQAILDAALEIIREEGPGALNMRALAERSDYSAAGLYEYFGGKDEIIAEVCQQGHERLASHMRLADPGLPVVDYLYEIGIGYIRFALENPDHFLLMFTVVPPGPIADFSPEKLLEGDSSFHILLGAIRRGIEEGAFVVRTRLRPDGDGVHGVGHRARHRDAARDQPARLPDGFRDGRPRGAAEFRSWAAECPLMALSFFDLDRTMLGILTINEIAAARMGSRVTPNHRFLWR